MDRVRRGKGGAPAAALAAILLAATLGGCAGGTATSSATTPPSAPAATSTARGDAPVKGSFSTQTIGETVYAAVFESPRTYIYAYDLARDAWSDRTTLEGELSEGGRLGQLDGRLYLHGGLAPDGTESQAVVEYAPATGASRLLAADEATAIRTRLNRGLDVAFPSAGGTFAWGPYDADGRTLALVSLRGSYVVDLYELDATGAWVKRSTMPSGRLDTTVVVADGMVYLCGGWTSGTDVSDLVERYAPASGTWTTIGRMSGPRWGAGGAVVDGTILLIGGKTTGWADETGGFTNDVESFAIPD